MDEHEELGRWIGRAQAQLSRLPASSHERRQQEHVIRRLEHARLRHSINRAHVQLQRLPECSEKARRLSDAIDRMQDEYESGWHELRSDLEWGGAVEVGQYQHLDERDDLAEVRRALRRALSLLMQPTADVRQAIVELERALGRLKGQSGP